MRRDAIIGGVISAFFLIILLVFSPDTISFVFVVLMCAIYVLGYIFGIFRLSRFNVALHYGRLSIQRARNVQTESTWFVLQNEDCVFGDEELDSEFKNYCLRMAQFGENGSMILPVEEYINQDFIEMHTRHNLMSQIPGTMTSLGILGTFLGLILGISGMGFSSLYLAIESIETLLSGIELAFYTSIAGVILAVVFNLTYHIIMERNALEIQLFLRDFHRYVLPSKEDAFLEYQLKYMKQMTCKMDQLIKQDGNENEV